MGKREMSQVSIFDLVIFLIMSELFSLALNDIDSSILHFVIPVIIIVILELVSAFISMKSIKVRNFLEGKVSFIIYKGEIDYLEMKKNRFNISDLMLQLRNKDIQSPIEVEFAILEGNGILNVIKKKDLLVEYPDPLIIDGKVNDEALKKLSLNENFLYSELSKLNYTSPSQIFFAQYLKQIVSKFFDERKIQYEIHLFYSGEEFIDLNMDMAKYHIVFLDINMEGLDGISTAKRLRELCKDIFVVFVTAFINYALEGYEVDAVRYILKNSPNFDKSVNECIETILEKMNYAVEIHTLKFKEGTKDINEDSIIYIESNLHELHFYIMTHELEVKRLDGTLNNMENNFDVNKFVRIHQSYLVNMKYIKSIKLQKVILINGSELPIAKPRYKTVRQIFANYKGEI